MKTFSVLILLVTLSAAYGLTCYNCVTNDPKSCTKTVRCVAPLDRCSSLEYNGLVTKTCLPSAACVGPVSCCTSDLCNSAVSTGSSVLFLLVSAAITSIFL
uniref:UPAR/Ly6 domain-containing protein n=1 Tax=Takifugu rubripes TaxID=31033 RepID=A0A3B5KD27_TAKRU